MDNFFVHDPFCSPFARKRKQNHTPILNYPSTPSPMTQDTPVVLDPHAQNTFVSLVHGQNITILPEFTLESGAILRQVPVGWKSWGKLSSRGDNVMVICHALSGSADVEDWWGPLIGPNKAFDTTKYFIFCANVLGSPYGTASPVTINPDTGRVYGPEFPLASVRDDVRLHRTVLEGLGIKKVAIVIGGSLGGMQVLEWAAFGPEFVSNIVPIATSGRHSAWCISWGEAQRQSIYSDPNYRDGYYTADQPPVTGLGAARMAALLTYRSRNSFESRFGRKSAPRSPTILRPGTPSEAAVLIHNDGHKKSAVFNDRGASNPQSSDEDLTISAPTPLIFSAQSYLRYQGDKFVGRFDANCYIAITRKMDVHDIARGRGEFGAVLKGFVQPALVIGIESDGLFTISEQYELAEHLPNSEMVVIQSPDGHDGFLLEFDQINHHILEFVRRVLPDIHAQSDLVEEVDANPANSDAGLRATKTSLFGEAEVDIVNW
ncbi:homoserine O-acetyltransferase [Endogone sp. FLAS-F59071]|nr:homoserine O-acetyltransferase [Endogone sp. FLAS-F59071]|eukprot:RUS17054.1 homoserine O-acetyltransferase [Endogone sp. FLAS-F59071]